MHLIIENLYLGDLGDVLAREGHDVPMKTITHLLTVIDGPHEVPVQANRSVERLLIDADDDESQDLLSYFQKSYDFIEAGRKSGNVLVHCAFGVSRSATLVVAYVMKNMKMNIEDALKFVRQKRPQIGPNSEFMRQLRLYQRMNYNLNSDLYRRYVFSRLTNDKEILDRLPFSREYLMTSGRSSLTANPTGERCEHYKCGKCRNYLFDATNIMPHSRGENANILDVSFNANLPDPCPEGIYVEPVAWMTDLLGQTEGKLYCHHCNAKLGTFSWVGTRCGCKGWILPAFHVHRGKKSVAQSSTSHPELQT